MLSGSAEPVSEPRDPQQRRRVRRTALLLTLVALVIYVGFIAYSILRGSH